MTLHLFARLAFDDWMIRSAAQRRTALVHTSTYTEGVLVGYNRQKRRLRIANGTAVRSYSWRSLVAIR